MMDTNFSPPLRRLAFIGGFLPRRSNSSAFTTHLCSTIASESGCEWIGLAVSDVPRQYAYPSRVRFEISQNQPDSYQAAADFLNLNDIDLVCLQHDFGLMDDEAGRYLLSLARLIRFPLLTVLHQVPAQPSETQRIAIADLAERSACLVCLSAGASQALQQIYRVPAEKIHLIEATGLALLQPGEADLWRDLARRFMDAAQHTRQAAAEQARRLSFQGQIPVTGADPDFMEVVPKLRLDHFLRMTDETGMLSASILSLPDYSQGYATTDNARALMFALLLEQVGEGPFIPIEMQASRHLAFLWNAYNPEYKRFREKMSYSRIWLDEAGSEDTHGLVLMALGMALGRSTHPGMTGVSRRLFDLALPASQEFSSLLAWGFSLLGVQEYLRRFTGDRLVTRLGSLLLDRLVSRYQQNAESDWPWFEGQLTTGSAIVPQALIASAQWIDHPRAVDIGLQSLAWLAEQQFSQDGLFIPFGDQGYIARGGRAAQFAQRPIEARGMISACLEAYRYTGDVRWLKYAQGAFQWFLGRNILGQPLYNPETGGCCDGLLPGHTDPNYSSGALLAFLLAQLEMRLFDQLYHQHEAAGADLPIIRIGPPSYLAHS